MRKIGVITVGRSDYGIYRPLLKQIMDDPELELQLIATGAHLDPRTGNTIDYIEDDGWPIAARVPMCTEDDSAAGIVTAMGVGISAIADTYHDLQPDLLVALGDRYDMFGAAAASVPFNIPIAHIHGGEITEGAIDDQFRHALTKLSHLHFASTQEYAKRIIQMGEEPWRVTVSGAPGLDNISTIDWLSREQLEQRLHIDLTAPPILITYHPVTRDWENTEKQIEILLEALNDFTRPLIFTYPNVDMGSSRIISAITRFAAKHKYVHLFHNLGTVRYFSLMKLAAAIVGNSSSGIIEAASFKRPVVNIGMRQQGRTCGRNVINTPCDTQAITQALHKALSTDFKATLNDLVNPYGTGHASTIIAEKLRTIDLGQELLCKKFFNIDF